MATGAAADVDDRAGDVVHQVGGRRGHCCAGPASLAIVTGDPWSPQDEEPAGPRRPGWGCLAAAILAAVGLVVLVVLATRVLGGALDGVRIR